MKTKKAALLGSASFFIGLACTVSGAQAQAQCSSSLTQTTVTLADESTMSLTGVTSAGGAAVGALVSAINTFNTAYLAQGSAFVANPPAQKEQTGGGIWIRGIGGHTDTTFNSTVTFGGIGGAANCGSGIKQTYAGYQIGADVGKLNLGNSGAYVHFGVTAGFGQANYDEHRPGTLSGEIEAPFVGAYATYANGNFFADFMARYNVFSQSLTEPINLGLYGQRLDAQGYSLQGSAGYRFDIPNSTWFFEPSGGVVYSNTKVDPLHFAGTEIYGGLTNTSFGILSIDDIRSTLVRLGARAGTTIDAGHNIIYQPFAAASVWHDFQSSSSATLNMVISGPPPLGTMLTGLINVSNVETYGQYSIGIARQTTDDGWVSYARIDYRKGKDIDALGFNGGIRYQFLPNAPGMGAFASAKAINKAPVAAPLYDWAGPYVGGFAGSSWGTDDWTMVSGPNDAAPPVANVISGTTSPKNAGLLGGGQIGYNFRAADWILGIEGDAGWTTQKGSKACPTSLNNQSTDLQTFIAFMAGGGSNPVSFFQCNNDRAAPVVSLAGRIGHSSDRVLLYVKGGGAWTRDSYSITFDSPPASPGGGPILTALPGNFLLRSASDNRFGWTVGAGFEFGITKQLSTKVEYDYLNFGTKTLVFADPLVPVTVSIKEAFNQVKVGLNYRLGGMP
jgi:outer membrane autotransporter protein